MAHIRLKKRQKGDSSGYYLVESRRSGPNNQPREHILKYIGTVENLAKYAAELYNENEKLRKMIDSMSSQKL